jgi:hypothetical protein
MCLDIPYVFYLISKHCPNLKHLHLNHIRLATNGKQVPERLEVPFHRLKISTLIPSFDASYKGILELTGSKVTNLHISFAELLTEGGLITIRDQCPHLERFQWEEKKEVFEENGGPAGAKARVDNIANILNAVPNVKVSFWPGWFTEDMKLTRMQLQEVKYVKGTFDDE